MEMVNGKELIQWNQ